MDRVYESAVSSTPPTAPETPLLGYPTSGNPATGIPATIQGAWNIHMIMEELRNVIIAAGIEPDAKDVTQLSQAILDIAQRQIPSATETDEGIARLATSAEALSGIGNNTIVTPETMMPAAAISLTPGSTSINLSVPATGGSVVAPDTGFLYLNGVSPAGATNVPIVTIIYKGMRYRSVGYISQSTGTSVVCPVANGDTVSVEYLYATSMTLQFFYAKGTQP